MAGAAAKAVALEVNADPHRLHLDWRVLQRVRDGGVMISIGAHAHSVAGIGHVDRQTGRNQHGGAGFDGDGLVDAGAQVQAGAARGGVGGQHVLHARVEDLDVDSLHG